MAEASAELNARVAEWLGWKAHGGFIEMRRRDGTWKWVKPHQLYDFSGDNAEAVRWVWPKLVKLKQRPAIIDRGTDGIAVRLWPNKRRTPWETAGMIGDNALALALCLAALEVTK